MGTNMVEARGLVKRFGSLVALDHLDLAVPEGTVLGLLGPNGAGKTTAVSILTTLLDADEGAATVAGIDVRTRPDQVRRKIGLSGQYAAVDEHLTGFENLEMIARLYGMGRQQAKARSRELLERFTLTDAGDRPVKGYSGGMRRRLDLAGALVAAPPVLFLDEPTTGLDPRSRNDLWDLIRELVTSGSTVLLTTQYLEEADQLADDIVVIDHGQAIAHGTASALKAQLGGERIEITPAPDEIDVVVAAVEAVVTTAVSVEAGTGVVSTAAGAGTTALQRVLVELERQGLQVQDIGLRRPTLDDVFLSLTGSPATPETTDPTSEETDR